MRDDAREPVARQRHDAGKAPRQVALAGQSVAHLLDVLQALVDLGPEGLGQEGPGARDENGKVSPLDVKAGDRVLFVKWSGTEVRIDGEDLLIMKESDIMGILDATAAKKKAA